MVRQHISLDHERDIRLLHTQDACGTRRSKSGRWPGKQGEQRTRISLASQQTLLLSGKSNELDIRFEGDTVGLDRAGNGEEMGDSRTVVVCTGRSGTSKGSTRIIVRAEKNERCGIDGRWIAAKVLKKVSKRQNLRLEEGYVPNHVGRVPTQKVLLAAGGACFFDLSLDPAGSDTRSLTETVP